MRVYFIRHGKTDGNQNKVFQHPNIPLSETGKKEACFLVERFHNIQLDGIISSTMQRARETAEMLCEQQNLPLQTLESLEEIKRSPSLYGKSRHDPEIVKNLNAWWENIEDEDWVSPEGGESYKDFKSRADSALKAIECENKENLAVVTHSIMLRMLLGQMVFGETLTPLMFKSLMFNLSPTNTGLSVAEYSKEKGWVLRVWNDYAHLADPD